MDYRFHMEVSGDGPGVVFLHGAPQDPADMSRLAELIVAEFRVCVVHLPGYGHSPIWPETPYRIPAVGRALARALAERGLTGSALVGMSGGSYRAFQLALDHPELEVAAMAHLGVTANLDDANREAMRGFGQALAAGVDMIEPGVARAFGPAYRAEHPREAREVIGRMLASVDPAGAEAELNGFAELDDLLPRLGALDTPTYLRVGELDAATPPDYARAAAERLPSAEIDVVPGVGHMLPYEDRDGTVSAVRAFLRDHVAT